MSVSSRAALGGKSRSPAPASPLLPPRFLFLEVNKRCNLKCQHCDFWQRDDADKANYISVARRAELIGEFASLNADGTVVICGGEPMLDLEDYFALAGASRRNGIKAVSVVNGTRIRDAALAERMIREGPHEISISLNSPDPAQHDETRGVKGAFDKAVRALRLLVEARARVGGSTRIYVMGLVFGSNYRSIEAFYDLVLNDIGADKLKLNFLQPSFGQAGETDPFFAAQGEVDPDALTAILKRCDAKFGLGFNPLWVEQVGMYFRSLNRVGDRARGWASDGATEAHICNSYDRNIMVNHYGMARLCFSPAFPGMNLEQPGDLSRFWRSAEKIRASMRGCNQFCGISHSVRRESSTVEGRQKMLDHQHNALPVAPADSTSRLVAGLQAIARFGGRLRVGS
ncbi:radical SAM protein [Xanthobacter sp. KR7-65]|uniref:radical SAM protein n=1 Tax=Xanthobacter sp. KR7-65 TaxID=3156612 RepID=UPI0032B4A6CE